MVFEGGGVVGAGGGFLSFEGADFNSTAIGLNAGNPVGAFSIAADAAIFGE